MTILLRACILVVSNTAFFLADTESNLTRRIQRSKMPSPFPGMDPYLEHPALWPDVHSRLATQISDQLAPLIEPRYVARLATRFVTDMLEPGEIGILYPDVDVVRARTTPRMVKEVKEAATRMGPAIVPAPLVLPAPVPTQVRLVTVEIRDAAGNELVAAIEILSPVNKREPGVAEYRRKREHVLGSQAHLLEIDLLRQGVRATRLTDLPDAPYFVFLTRADRRAQVEVWPIYLRAPLPVVPVPLRPPDADVSLDLDATLSAIYDRARYHLSIDYRREPVPPLTEEDAQWADALLVEQGQRHP